MSVSSAQRNLSRKALDPVFLCMVGAMVLAVASSLMLRAVVGPRPASAADASGLEMRSPAPLPPHHAPPARHPQ